MSSGSFYPQHSFPLYDDKRLIQLPGSHCFGQGKNANKTGSISVIHYPSPWWIQIPLGPLNLQEPGRNALVLIWVISHMSAEQGLDTVSLSMFWVFTVYKCWALRPCGTWGVPGLHPQWVQPNCWVPPTTDFIKDNDTGYSLGHASVLQGKC